jgi:hypothetical protein
MTAASEKEEIERIDESSMNGAEREKGGSVPSRLRPDRATPDWAEYASYIDMTLEGIGCGAKSARRAF